MPFSQWHYCLKAGNKLIVVVPAITTKTDIDVALVRQQYCCAFQQTIKKLLPWMHPEEQPIHVEWVIRDDHKF